MSRGRRAGGKRPTLIVGFSTRAIAESAVSGGYDVVTLDYFGDRDQKERVENYSLMRDFGLGFSAEALVAASRGLEREAVVYTSSLENHPNVVEELTKGHTLLGNTPQILREVRHWPTLRSFCREEAIPFPCTFFSGEALPESGCWLRKPLRSGGGHGISFWRQEPVDDSHLLQEYIGGTHASAAILADGQRCVLLGITEQLIGREELGARGFTWCGNILPPALPSDELVRLSKAVEHLAAKFTRHFGLRGVNGLDFVLAHDQGRVIPYLVEVNPRYTASMELVEWAYDLNVFDAHVRSFDGELPAFHLGEHFFSGPASYFGKAIVYARHEATMPETAGWRGIGRRDVPFPGERIGAGHPICTALAEAESRDKCWHRLLAAARAVYQEVEEPVLDGERER